jgi:predicted transcriptional regulator of viral defense system
MQPTAPTPTAPTGPAWPDLLRAAVGQAGYFTTADAAACGFSPELLIHHVRAGRLERARRGVYRVVHLPPADDEDLVVLWLWSARRGVFSHRTALALHQLSDLLPAQADLCLPAADATRRLRVPAGLHLHYADLGADDPVWIGHVPVTGVVRTLADCAALPIAPDLLQQALSEAAQRGLAPRAALERIAAGGLP